ncbi:unnamed protein product, partial [Oppiella nova]
MDQKVDIKLEEKEHSDEEDHHMHDHHNDHTHRHHKRSIPNHLHNETNESKYHCLDHDFYLR